LETYSYKLTIQGIVQGVGFRPFVYTLAKRYNLNGTVSNGSNGVEIFVNASKEILEQFMKSIEDELPSLASIESLELEEVAFQNFQDFQIIKTKNRGEITVNIPPYI
jgi:hydrogenase maturation protein HypF